MDDLVRLWNVVICAKAMDLWLWDSLLGKFFLTEILFVRELQIVVLSLPTIQFRLKPTPVRLDMLFQSWSVDGNFTSHIGSIMRMRFVKVGCEAKGEWICCQLYVKDDPGRRGWEGTRGWTRTSNRLTDGRIGNYHLTPPVLSVVLSFFRGTKERMRYNQLRGEQDLLFSRINQP